MIILGIETSCDETALSIVEITEGDKTPHFKVLSNVLISQTSIHEQYGGVFPMIAKREHAKNLTPLLHKALEEAGLYAKAGVHAVIGTEHLEEIKTLLAREPELFTLLSPFLKQTKKPHIDALAVTTGPGLEPALWVGINFAKALASAWNIPVVPVNHMEGHVVASLLNPESTQTAKVLQTISFPTLAVLLSGGHTEMIHLKSWREYEMIGQTKDDAVGEAFDKVARILGLPYPGGPQISKLAEEARKNPTKLEQPIQLPRPMLHSGDYSFSFSGLKTAVLYLVQSKTKASGALSEKLQREIAREFEDAVTEVITAKTRAAIEQYGIQTIILGGGVVANTHIRNAFSQMATEYDIPLHLPTGPLSTDNALMITIAGYYVFAEGGTVDPSLLKAQGNMRLAA